MSLMMPAGFLSNSQPPPTNMRPLNLEFGHLPSVHSPKTSPRSLLQQHSMPRNNGPQESYFGLSPRGNRENPMLGQNMMGVSPFQAATQNILPVYYIPVAQPQPLSHAIQNHQLYGPSHLDRAQPQQQQNNGIQREMHQLSQLNKELRDLQTAMTMKNQKMSRARSDYGAQFLTNAVPRASMAMPRPDDGEKVPYQKRSSLLVVKERQPERDEVVQFGQNLSKNPLLPNRLDRSTDHSNSPKFLGNNSRPRFNPSFDNEEYGTKPTEVSYSRNGDPNISQFFKRKENRQKSQFDGNYEASMHMENSLTKSPLLSSGSKGKKEGGIYDFDMNEFQQKLPPIQASPSYTNSRNASRKTSQKFYPGQQQSNDLMLREILVKNRNRNSDMESKANKYSFDIEPDNTFKELAMQKTRSSRPTKVLHDDRKPVDSRSLDPQRYVATEKSEEPREDVLDDMLAQTAKNQVRSKEKKMSLMGSFYPQMMSPKSTFNPNPKATFNFKVMADLHQKQAAAMLSEEEDKKSTKAPSPKEEEAPPVEEKKEKKEKKSKRPNTKKKLRIVKKSAVEQEHETPIGTLDELSLSVGSLSFSQSYERGKVNNKGKRV